jgi:DNA-binding MarR family transcriptional regulator
MVAYYNQWMVKNLLAQHPAAQKVYAATSLGVPRTSTEIAELAGVKGPQLDEALNRLLGVGAIVREHHGNTDHYVKVVDL